MREVGIDISEQTSKSVDTIKADTVDTVVTLCAEEVLSRLFEADASPTLAAARPGQRDRN